MNYFEKKMILSAFAAVQRVADNPTSTMAQSVKDLERNSRIKSPDPQAFSGNKSCISGMTHNGG
jgi:hypothetical protein